MSKLSPVADLTVCARNIKCDVIALWLGACDSRFHSYARARSAAVGCPAQPARKRQHCVHGDNRGLKLEAADRSAFVFKRACTHDIKIAIARSAPYFFLNIYGPGK